MARLPPDFVVSLAWFTDVTHRVTKTSSSIWSFPLLIMSVTPGLFCVNKQEPGDDLGHLFCETYLSRHKELGVF